MGRDIGVLSASVSRRGKGDDFARTDVRRTLP
jgi:hypothetical protein